MDHVQAATRMKVLGSLLAAVIAACIIWMFGGPLGAWLNAPGFLVLRGAVRMGHPGAGHDSTLREWLWLGTILSVLFWWLVAYLALAVIERKGTRR